MSGDRRKKIIRHLSDEYLDRLLSETDDPKAVRRLTFVKNIYAGDTLEEAATRSESLNQRAVDRHDDGTKVASDSSRRTSGTDVPPKLGEDEQEQLVEMLCEHQPWQPQEIQHLINEEFGVEYYPVYLSEFLKGLDLSYVIPRQSGLPDQKTPKIFSPSVSMTRSPRTRTSTITNARTMTMKAGLLTTMSVRTVVPLSAFLMRHIHSRTTTHAGSGTSMICIMNDRWFRFSNQRSDSMHSTVKAWLAFRNIKRKNGYVSA